MKIIFKYSKRSDLLKLIINLIIHNLLFHKLYHEDGYFVQENIQHRIYRCRTCKKKLGEILYKE